MKLGDQYEVEGYDFLGFRWILGIGVHLYHSTGNVLKVVVENDQVKYAEFEGLTILLPFIEIKWGSIWFPTGKVPSRPSSDVPAPEA